MAMAPKKKFDFFNGGRGINLDDIDMEDSSQPPPPPVPIERDEISQDPYTLSGGDWGQYSASRPLSCGQSNSSSPPLPQGQSHPEYLPDYPETSLSGSQSPTGYSDHSQGGYHMPDGYSSHRKKKKRHQRCRLCANHGVYVEVKGHKWYCPYRDAHNCDKCEITRKRQYYMAEQQKLTREQQQQLQAQHNRRNNNICPDNIGGLCSGVGGVGGASTSLVSGSQPEVPSSSSSSSSSLASNALLSPVTHPREFPRLDELVRETANIINEDLFEKINQVVRPRAKQ